MLMTSREFTLFLFGRFFSQLATRIGDFVFPLAIYKTTGSVALSGFALALEWLPRVVGLPLCGALADRFRSASLLAGADATRAALAVVPFFFFSVPVLLSVSAFFGFLSALSQVTLERTVATSGRPLKQAQMSLEALNNLAFILGSAFAAALIGYLPLKGLFLVFPVVFLLAIPFALHIDRGRVRGQSTLSLSLIEDISIACGILAKTVRLRRILFCGFLLAIIAGIVTSMTPAMISAVFNLPNTAFAQVQLWAAIASFFAILANRFLPSVSAHIHWTGLGGIGVGLIVIATATYFPLWVAGYGIFFAGIVLFSIWLRCERIALIPPAHYGKALGVVMVMTAAGFPVGGLLVGCFATLASERAICAMTWPVFVVAVAASGLCNPTASRKNGSEP